jgi:hypothetical protein
MRTQHTASAALAAYLILWIGGALRAGAQQGGADTTSAANANAVAWLRYVADEVRKLRLEVLELRQENQEGRTPELERDLLLVQAERQRLEQEVSVHSQEIFSLDRQIAQPGLPAEEQQQLFARKADLSAEVSERLRTRQNALARQEAAARERLDQQQRRVRATLARKSELLPGGAQSQN